MLPVYSSTGSSKGAKPVVGEAHWTETLILLPATPLVCQVTWSKSFHHTVPQFPCKKGVDYYILCKQLQDLPAKTPAEPSMH